MSTKIFFGNYKGGVGKTTSVFQIGINMAQNHNKKVLLLDLDPQASLSKICSKFTNKQLDSIHIESTLNYLLEVYILMFRRYGKLDILSSNTQGRPELIKKAIFTKDFDNSKGSLSFIPTRMDIVNGRINDIAEQTSRYSMGIVGISKLIDNIQHNIDKKFDYILIDCPPSINAIIQAMFLKSDYYLIPTIADDISVSGVMDYIKVIEKTVLKYTYDSAVGSLLLEKVFSKPPVLIGILETMANTRSREITKGILNGLNEELIKNNIEVNQKSKPFMRKSSEYKNYIFENNIRHLDNKTDANNLGIPQKTVKAQLHTEYEKITSNIISICEEKKDL